MWKVYIAQLRNMYMYIGYKYTIKGDFWFFLLGKWRQKKNYEILYLLISITLQSSHLGALNLIY